MLHSPACGTTRTAVATMACTMASPSLCSSCHCRDTWLVTSASCPVGSVVSAGVSLRGPPASAMTDVYDAQYAAPGQRHRGSSMYAESP